VGVAALQPTAGRFQAVQAEIHFVPRYPLAPGTTYSLLVGGVEEASATIAPQTGKRSTRVVALYPTAHEVPLNLLKIYIQFSASIGEGQALRAIEVRRADTGAVLEGVFLPMEPELWDPSRARLTLLLDPGRIKRGLAPHLELGYPLDEGVPVVARVSDKLRDANGVPLLEGFERRYAVGHAVRRHVMPADWRVQAPGADSREPLHVEFDRPLDRALLQHSLVVRDSLGRAVGGEETIGEEERSWSFTPRHPWHAERHTLTVDARLEDLAGNSLTRVFDRDLSRPEDAPLSLAGTEIYFEPREVSRRAQPYRPALAD